MAALTARLKSAGQKCMDAEKRVVELEAIVHKLR